MEQPTQLSSTSALRPLEEAKPPAFLNQTGKVYWTKNKLQARVEQIHETHVVIRCQGMYSHCAHNGVMNGYNNVLNEEVPAHEVKFKFV